MDVLVLCLTVFFVRILDVSVGTVRTIITVKGKTTVASIVSFFEVLVWFLVVREALTTTNGSIWIAISYAGGFATGTYIGGFISNRFIKTIFTFEIITSKYNLVEELRAKGYGVTVLDIKDEKDKIDKYMLIVGVNNSVASDLKNYIRLADPDSFVLVTEKKAAQNGYLEVK